MCSSGTRLAALAALVTACLIASLGPLRSATAWAAAPPPNVVIILTDDQRASSFTRGIMPRTYARVAGPGLRLTNFVVQNPTCCPSRATLLTGRYSSTTGVLRNHAPRGGWPAFDRYGEERTIARALDRTGYRTALIGKYLNQYRRAGGAVPGGWDRWFVFDEDNGEYFRYRIADRSEGDTRTRSIRFGDGAHDYSTDVIADEAIRTIRQTPSTEPLFMLVAPFAPHLPSTPAPRDRGRHATTPVRSTAAFNEDDLSDKPAWVRRLGRADPDAVASRTRRQWEALAAVDRLVGRVIDALRTSGRLRDTVVIYSSDNGLNAGEHRWQGKLAPYEESIGIPFAMRYDRGRWQLGDSDALASNLDIAPTIADLTGVELRAQGRSMVPFLERRRRSIRRWVRLEHLGPAPPRGGPPTYCGIRTSTYTFVRYQGGDEEFYDLRRDPAQLTSRTSGQAYHRVRRLAERACRDVGLW